MLFDLRGRGRQNSVKVIYGFLALLMGGGLVLFGIGSGSSGGGLLDAVTGGGSSGDTGAKRFEKQITQARAQLRTDRHNETAWGNLIRAQVNLAGSGSQYNTATQKYNAKGKADLRAATLSWKTYEALPPKNKDNEGRVASRIAQAYVALEDLPGLVDAQEIVALNRNATGPYAALAQYAYLAGQTRKGDLAARKALSLADPSERNQLKGDLAQYKQQGAQAAPSAAPVQTVTAAPKAKKTKKK
jgi:hypothetical protein